MKNYVGLFYLLLMVVLLSSFNARDTVKEEMDEVVIALKAGNAGKLSRFFDMRVDLNFPDKSENYSRNQAAMVVRDFFNNNGVISFELKQTGEKNNANYCVGTLITKGGNFRTTLFMKQKGNRDFVQEISFQPEH